MKHSVWSSILLALPAFVLGANHTERISSPDDRVTVQVTVGAEVRLGVRFAERPLLADAPLSLTLADGTVLGRDARWQRTDRHEIDRTLRVPVPVKAPLLRDHFREMSLHFAGHHGLVVRVYDDAVAYRWTLERAGRVRVRSEEVVFRFADDARVLFPEEDSFLTHSERLYRDYALEAIQPEQFCSLPALVTPAEGPRVLLTEADLRDYPGLYLQGTGGPALSGRFPAVALAEEQKNDRTVAVTRRADYLAETDGTRRFPWRVAIIAPEDRDLLTNETVYKLAAGCELSDTSWIRPGKVAWDWWNANNLFGVDFTAGVNTETYRAYIDFAAANGLEYIILDEGWYPLGDLLKVSPGMDMEALFAYAKTRGVRIVLWVVWKTLLDQLEPALDRFAAWGAAGIKVDFMQRDDQWMVNVYETIAREAARRHLLVDFHGSYSPKGLRRRFPNVISREGVKGLENCKWSADITPEHCVTLPFTRMVAGPMDFTPGAMRNGQGKDFAIRFNRPMSQGTRCQQLALYVIYESPLQMLADSPSQYRREPDCMAFLSAVPSVWDETVALDAQVGDYALMARRHGEDWYVGALTDGTARDLAVDLSFLGTGAYRADVFADGPNAARYAEDFQRRQQRVTASDRIPIHLAAGGGWVARLTRE